MSGMLLWPGFKFQPTDKELVSFYLSTNNPVIKFSDDVYKKPPSEYCTDSTAYYGHDNIAKHYFFTKLSRPNRTAERKVGSCGLWHGSSRKNIVNNNNVTIGWKRLLKFKPVEGECTDTEPTEWIMHEFSLHESERPDLVLCVIQNKKKEEEKGSGSRLFLVWGSGSGSGYGGSSKITSVESIVTSADPGSPRSVFDNPDMFDGADAEIWTGGPNDHLADDTDPQFDPMSLLLDPTTTANEDPCRAPDEEIQRSMNMRSDPQFDDDLFSVCSGCIDPTLPNLAAPIFSPECDVNFIRD